MAISTRAKVGIGGSISAATMAILLVFIPAKEGVVTHAYWDKWGHVWTICDGETKGVYAGETATKAECLDKLKARLPEFAAGDQACLKPGLKISDSRWAAIISFSYNVGVGGFCRSSFAKRLNEGDPNACDSLLLYDRAGGEVLPGLKTRREQERNLCNK